MSRVLLALGCLLIVSCGEEELAGIPAAPHQRSPEFAEVTLTEPLDRVDTYQQIDAQVDILWVIDNSRSMVDEQAKLADNFNQFISFMIQTMVDYHVGVTSTDMSGSGQGGALVGDPKFITPDTPDAVLRFADAVKLPLAQRATEQGLLAAVTALSEPNLSGVNAGFVRPEAGLFVIVVSDEDDSSFGPVEYYQREMRSLKGPGNEDMISLSAIVGPEPDGCTPPGMEDIFGGQVYAGRRYIKMVEATGGTSWSICEEDFGPALSSLGISVAGLKRIFPLSREPMVETIRVYVNGEEISEDPERGWTYLGETFSIYFGGAYVPESRATVEVHYKMKT